MIDPQPLQRGVAGRADILRPAVDPAIGRVGGADECEFRGQDDRLRLPLMALPTSSSLVQGAIASDVSGSSPPGPGPAGWWQGPPSRRDGRRSPTSPCNPSPCADTSIPVAPVYVSSSAISVFKLLSGPPAGAGVCCSRFILGKAALYTIVPVADRIKRGGNGSAMYDFRHDSVQWSGCGHSLQLVPFPAQDTRHNGSPRQVR